MKLPSIILLLALFVFSTVSAAENPVIRGSRELRTEGKPRKLEKPTKVVVKPSKLTKEERKKIQPGKKKNFLFDHRAKARGCAGHVDEQDCDADTLCCWKGENMKGKGFLCGEIGHEECTVLNLIR